MKKKQINTNKFIPVFSVIIVIIVWELVTTITKIPHYVLPSFSLVMKDLFKNIDLLLTHTYYTLTAALVGLFLSVIIAFATALLLDQSKRMKSFMYPIIAISQTVPLMAVAPLFIIWFGFGILPKILIVILVCFFPITMNILTGFEEIDEDTLDLFHVMKAPKKDIYLKLKFPASIPYFFSGLKIAATYAILAAFIGEFMGGNFGLGYYLVAAQKSFSIPTVFAIIIFVISTTLLLLFGISLIEKKLLKYKEK